MAELILIDGRSGSGKTELGAALAAARGAQLLRLDDLYPGWDGLDAASAMLPQILSTGSWRRWDWVTGAPAQWCEFDPEAALVVEGAGALSRASRPLASTAIWVELDEANRKRRALKRDGESYGQFWDRWAAQEEAFAARENPRELADLVVDGSRAETALSAVLRLLSESRSG